MKLTRLTTILTLGLILSFAAAGCKHKTPGTTKLPYGGPGTTGEPSPGPGATMPGQPTELAGGIPSNPAGSHDGWVPHADILKADTVHFAFDSSVIRPEEQSKVAAVADYLKSNASDAVRIEGHCDERGTEEYNRALGDRRAQALREELARIGIDPTRVDTVTFGKDKPVAQGHDETAWSQNRRGEFIVLTPPK